MSEAQKPQNRHWLRTFALIWTGQIFSLIGSGVVQFALVWWLTEKTQSAAVLATATFVALLPEVFVGPFAGALVDRWNRRLVMIFADAFIALATVVLVILFWLGVAQVWHVFVILFIRAVGGVFHYPAMAASTSLLVPQEQLSRVAGVNQALRGIINIGAPPLGALLYSLLKFHWVLSVDIFTAMLAILPLLFVRIPQPVAEEKPMVTPKQLFKEVKEGFKFLMSWPGAIALLVIAMLINFVLGPSSTLLPLLVKNHFGGNAWHLSAVESVFGIGIILGGLLLGIWGGFKRKMITSLIGVGSIGFGILLTGIAPRSLFWLALVGNAMVGFTAPIANGPLQAIMQTYVPANMQGRVFTLIGSLATAMMPLSMIIAAPIAQWLGVRAWFIIGGVVTILIGFGAFLLPKVVHIEDHRPAIQQAIAVDA
jgi:DHA3 family macrolide efflux protein-like MFS transporter